MWLLTQHQLHSNGKPHAKPTQITYLRRADTSPVYAANKRFITDFTCEEKKVQTFTGKDKPTVFNCHWLFPCAWNTSAVLLAKVYLEYTSITKCTQVWYLLLLTGL